MSSPGAALVTITYVIGVFALVESGVTVPNWWAVGIVATIPLGWIVDSAFGVRGDLL